MADSVQEPEQPMELGAGGPVAWNEGESGAELADGGVELTPLRKDPSQVDVRIVARLVPGCRHRALEPAFSLLVTTQPDEIRTDVVVRVAEVGIDLDGALALPDGSCVVAAERQRPPEERVR